MIIVNFMLHFKNVFCFIRFSYECRQAGFRYMATPKIQNKQSACDEVLIKRLYCVILKSIRVIYSKMK